MKAEETRKDSGISLTPGDQVAIGFRTLDIKRVPSELDQATYFSSWLYSCIHIYLTCSTLRTPEAISNRLNIPLSRTREILDFLVSTGLAAETKHGYETGDARMHLGTDSPLLLKHHLNWNLRAMIAIEENVKSGLHYSSVVSLSERDLERVREIWTKSIADVKAIVKDSPSETVYGFTINLFKT